MGRLNRLQLHERLLQICDHCYYQPTKNITMEYPCVVYNRSDVSQLFANNSKYRSNDVYSLTVIDRDPDSEIPDLILQGFTMSSLSDSSVVDNLHHTYITLYT